MQEHLGAYLMGNDVSREADETKTRFAIDILVKQKPRFMTLHLGSLDYVEHEQGPFSAAANQDLESIDEMVGRLIAASRKSDPAAIVVVVSDHGFVALTHRVNLPAWGIDEILDAQAMQQRGGFPGASFVISMKPGYYTGGNFSGDAVTDFAGHGGHGFAPHHPEMRAALFIAGRGIARHRDLGQIDMRQVAPTVAALLGVKLWSATAPALLVRQ
jgi:hypothetical protein